MPIELTSVWETATLQDPWGNLSEQRIEHRTDPLTGVVASFNTALGEKARQFLGTTDLELLSKLEESSRGACPFCSAAEKGTHYLPAFSADKQIRLGKALAMPNLFSKCAHDSVVIVDPQRHVLAATKIEVGVLADTLRLSASLVQRVRAQDGALVHHAVGMNFLQPGGSSVPHPHFQVHVRGVPYSNVARVLSRSKEHAQAAGESFWTALVAAERASGQRYVGATGPVEWLAAWAPSGQREVWGVLPGASSLLELDEAGAAGFAAGLSKVASHYERIGQHPFTLAFFSSPDAGRRDFALHVRICARPALRSLFVNYDTWFSPKLLGDEVHTEAPESLAAALRAGW